MKTAILIPNVLRMFFPKQTATTKVPLTEKLLIGCFMVCAVCFTGAEPASATVLDNFGTAVLEILNNNFLRSLAIAALIVMAILALGGKVSAGAFIICLLAITIVFGSAGIVDFIRTNATTVNYIPVNLNNGLLQVHTLLS